MQIVIYSYKFKGHKTILFLHVNVMLLQLEWIQNIPERIIFINAASLQKRIHKY